MLNIHIQTIPDDSQRYNTVGDYYHEKNKEIVHVSDMGDWRYEMLTAVHEIIESALCKHRGILDATIDAFDFEFERSRQAGDTREPGDSADAPYHKEHSFASQIEKMLAAELDVDWSQYDAVTKKLDAGGGAEKIL